MLAYFDIELRQMKRKTDQDQSEGSNHQSQLTRAKKCLALVEQMGAVRENSANLGCGGPICLVLGRGEAFPRAEVNDYPAPFYRKLGVPFPNIGADSDLNRFKRHDEFVSIHFGIEVRADQVGSDLAAGLSEEWNSVYRSFFFRSLLYRGNPNRKVLSNHREMSKEEG